MIGVIIFFFQICANVELMLHALKTILKVDFGGIHKLIDQTLCKPLRNTESLACVDRLCENCGFQLISNDLNHLDRTTLMTWFKWGRKEGETKVTNFAVEGNLEVFLEQLEQLVNGLAKHLFVAR